jgi:DNA-binding transcriptional regulator YbjK
MTPQEIQRMMDFILRSNANFFVSMEKSKEELQAWRAEVQETHRKIAAEIRDLLKSQRKHAEILQKHEKSQQRYERSQQRYERSQQRYEKRLRALEASDRRTRRRVEGIKDLLKLFSKRADVHSKRIDRLERNGR